MFPLLFFCLPRRCRRGGRWKFMWKFVRFFRLKIAHVEVCDVDVCIISVKVFRKQEVGTFLNT